MLAALLVVLPVFGLIALGYLARWTKLLRETTGEGLSDFVFVLAVPCLLFVIEGDCHACFSSPAFNESVAAHAAD